MTEHEWLTSVDPRPMLIFVQGKVSDRKLRLYACSCCRCVCDRFELNHRQTIEIAERFADGQATTAELVATANKDAPWTDGTGAWEAAWEAADAAACEAACEATWDEWESIRDVAWAREADLLRDVVGNPFRPSSADAAWLTWNDGAIRKLAQEIYDERQFDKLLRLADALQGAGCTDATILEHCRSGGPHARGCFVLDLLLNKDSIPYS